MDVQKILLLERKISNAIECVLWRLCLCSVALRMVDSTVKTEATMAPQNLISPSGLPKITMKTIRHLPANQRDDIVESDLEL